MTDNSPGPKILVRGAGEMATGIAYHLHINGCRVCLTEIASPLAVSRANAFSDAVFDGTKIVCDVTAMRIQPSIREIEDTWSQGNIPLVIDTAIIKEQLHPDVVVDATMTKIGTSTKITDASLVIGIGPGFDAGKNVHIVIETNDSKGDAGKLIFKGEAEKNTNIPMETGGVRNERVIWAALSACHLSIFSPSNISLCSFGVKPCRQGVKYSQVLSR